jgi:hypothetical protein
LLVAALLVCAAGPSRVNALDAAEGERGACRPAPAIRGVTEGEGLQHVLLELVTKLDEKQMRYPFRLEKA